MQRLYRPARLAVVFILVTIFITIYVSALYRYQIFETYTPEGEIAVQKTITRIVSLPASRGNIYDRNGVLLASGRPSYNITLNRMALLSVPNRNAIIMELIYAAIDADVRYNDTFPVTRGAPFMFLTEMTAAQRSRLNTYLEYFALDPGISASDLLAWMREHYGIDFTIGISDARLICGIRYELEIRAIIWNLAPYVFANDVSSEFVTYIEERGLIGVHTEVGFIREYHTTYATHLLGYIGAMTPSEYERYGKSPYNYPMDALIGKTGAELAFEEQLRGVSGLQIIRMDDTGAVTDIITTREPDPGNHVYLSMDLGLQIATEHALRTQIDILMQERELKRQRGETDPEVDDVITGGAVVVTNVRTGEILALATYPTYDPMTLASDYALLSNDPMKPLINRATQGRYNPGSTYKMITAFTGLRSGTINRHLGILDEGRYMKYADVGEGFTPACWYYNAHRASHGVVDVVRALECSCNYFFIYVADNLGDTSANNADALAATAMEFGLGLPTGLELPENTGRLATPEWKQEALNQGWKAADTILAGFGQGHNMFTPIQLANYAATIANGGIRNRLTILRRIKSDDFTELLYSHEPEVLSTIAETEYVSILQEGMIAVTHGSRGTAKSVFSDYPVNVAAKTGTVQVEGQDTNDGVFICYAPANNPEIAISIVVEKGGSGSSVMDIARMIFDYYFRAEITVLATPFGELIP